MFCVTSNHKTPIAFCFKGLIQNNRNKAPDGSWPAFAARNKPFIHAITAWHSLFPSSSACIIIGTPCGELSLLARIGDNTGLPGFVNNTEWFRAYLSTGGIVDCADG
jgi:hypothetical protein